MNKQQKLMFRKTKKNLPQLLGMGILILVGVCFFLTMFTLKERYQERAEAYFHTNKYADFTAYGSFSKDQVKELNKNENVQIAAGRRVSSVRKDGLFLQLIEITGEVNALHIYDGVLPKNKEETAILKRFAEAHGLQVGDQIEVKGKDLTVSALVDSPEYIYYVSESEVVSVDSYGVLFVDSSYFEKNLPFSQICILQKGGLSEEDIEKSLPTAVEITPRKDQLNYNNYLEDLDQFQTFAVIFPTIFAILIFAMIYVLLKRTISKERKQIGIMKALGAKSSTVYIVYLGQVLLAALLFATFGCVITKYIYNIVVQLMGVMLQMPDLSFVFYPNLLLVAIGVPLLVAFLSGFLALRKIQKQNPAKTMQVRMPSGGKKILLERIPFLWNRFQFNTRYALKSTFRNKGRFFAVILGMVGSCALLVFSLGFKDSIDNTIDSFFNEVVNYDLIINPEIYPKGQMPDVFSKEDKTAEVLTLSGEVEEKKYPLVIVEDDFDMLHNLKTNKLQEGVVISEQYAKIFKVKEGESFTLNGKNVKVSEVVPMTMGHGIFTTFTYAKTIFEDLPEIRNAIYLRGNNLTKVEETLKDREIDYTTTEENKEAMNNLMGTMNAIVALLVACAVLLGLTVLYSVGLINLTAREYEYMFMGIMGYASKDIMKAHTKETLLQLIISLPLGVGLGYLLLQSIQDAFSGEAFTLAPTVKGGSVIFSLVIVVVMTMIVGFVTYKHISKMDIVEGLKVQDE